MCVSMTTHRILVNIKMNQFLTMLHSTSSQTMAAMVLTQLHFHKVPFSPSLQSNKTFVY